MAVIPGGRPFGPRQRWKVSADFPLPPTLTSVTQNYDRVVGGTSVTLTGDHFLPGATVKFGTVLATSVVVVSSTSITCLVPANAEGVYDITVTNPDLTTSTLSQVFTYIAGHINVVSPARGLTVGGQTVLITGVNFVTGSTIAFGGVAATNVIFVDNTRFYCTTPAHADGFVDVVITEPSTAVVTGRGLFGYTSSVFNEDIRRSPSIRVTSTLNRGPNTAEFAIDGSSVPPIGGEKIILTDGDNLVFAGLVQNVAQDIEDSKFNKVWTISAVDWTGKFNKRRPFGVWNNVSVSLIVRDLVTQFAPEFNTAFVQSGLPRMSVVLKGEVDLVTVITDLAKAMGEGHFYLDYKKSVHFFLLNALGTLNAAPNQALINGPGSSMVVTDSTVPTLGYNFVAGWYYFYGSFYYAGSTAVGPNAKVYDSLTATGVSVMATRANASGVFLNYGQAGTPSQAALPGQTTGAPRWIMLSEQAANRNLQGDISNGVYCTGRLQPRGWTGVDADGNQIPDGQWPAAGPNAIYFASSDVWLALETASGGSTTPAVADFESALTPISNLVFLSTFLPNFGSIPIGPTIGGRACTRRNIYAVRFSDVLHGGGSKLIPWSHIDDNATTSAAPSPSVDGYFRITSVPDVSPPASAGIVPPTGRESLSLNTAATFANATNCQAGYYALIVTGVYQDGTESAGTKQTGPFLMTGTKQCDMDGIPIFPPVNGVPCIFRKIYAAIYTPYHPVIVLGVPDFGNGSQLVYILGNNTASGATFPIGSGLTGGVTDNPTAPPLLKDVAGAVQLQIGPDLESIDTPDDIDDDNDDLQLNPPFSSTSDSSQLRNRVFVKGRGSILTADAAVGDLQILVSDVGTYITPSGSGRIVLGNRILAYSGLTVTTGAGAIKLQQPLVSPILQADWLFGGGQPVLPFVQVDDLASQARQGAIETDDDGHATDGIHEYTIVDDTLTTYQQMIARGLAELKQFSKPIVQIKYSTRDAKSRPGKVVHVDLSDPPITGDFIIQEVVIDQYHDESDTLTPRYNVIADSAARMNFVDLLHGLIDDSDVNGLGSDSNAAGSPAGILTTAATSAGSAIAAAVAAATSAVQAFSATYPASYFVGASTNPVVIMPAIPGYAIVPVFWMIFTSKTAGTGWTNGNTGISLLYDNQPVANILSTTPMSLGQLGSTVDQSFFNSACGGGGGTSGAGNVAIIGKALLGRTAVNMSGAGSPGFVTVVVVYALQNTTPF